MSSKSIKSIKSYLQINQKYLGTLLYFKDVTDRGCLKLSFKNKIANFFRATDIPTTLPVPARLLTGLVQLDISYKFQDNLLEVKKLVDGVLEREFYKITLPMVNHLFIIKIKDWHSLDDAMPSNDPLILHPPSDSVVIVFSFTNTDGDPIAPEEYYCEMGVIDLPESPLSQFCIGIAGDSGNINTDGFIIHIPFIKA